MTTRAIIFTCSAIAAAMSASEASALVPLSLDDSIDPQSVAVASPDAMLAPQAFEALPDAQFVPNARVANRRAHLQCVPFAREEAGLDIHGNANTWWAQAKNHFTRADRPSEGSVMVLRGYAGPNRGHVAVVREIVSERMVIVDHANWLNHGEITRDVPVRDVSPNNDWSQVQVWYVPGHHWGGRTYNVQGFILNQIVQNGEAGATQTADAR
jgi:surface antigen